MSILEDAKSWMKLNPNRVKLLNNDEVCLTYYATRHPEKNIVPDFELKKSKIHVDTQIYIPNYDDKFFEFTLTEGLADYTGNKFGWQGPYAGVSKYGMSLCQSTRFDLKIIAFDEVYSFKQSVMEAAILNKWSFPKIGYRPKIYALPIHLAGKSFLNRNNKTLTDFVN